MYKVYLYLLIIVFIFSSCSTIKTQTQREFAIYRSTPVTVVWDRDPLGIGTMIEMKLLELGIDAVPYEVAQRRAEQRSSVRAQIYRDGIDARSRTQVSDYIETPTAIIINFAYSWVDDLFSPKLHSFQCRIIDLETERVLAVINFRGGSLNSISPNRAVNKVGEVLGNRLR